MKNKMKIVKSPEESGLLTEWISETIKSEAKEQKGGFLPMLFGIFAASLLGSPLTRKRVIRAGKLVKDLVKIFNASWLFD